MTLCLCDGGGTVAWMTTYSRLPDGPHWYCCGCFDPDLWSVDQREITPFSNRTFYSTSDLSSFTTRSKLITCQILSLSHFTDSFFNSMRNSLDADQALHKDFFSNSCRTIYKIKIKWSNPLRRNLIYLSPGSILC